MSWKKNAFSYLMWFVYTLMTGNALMGLAGLFCEEAGLAVYWGIFFAVLYAVIVAAVVFSVRRAVRRASSFLERNRTLFLVLEASWAAAFLALGLALRAGGMDGAGQAGEYYEAAKVAMGQEIPQVAHGAVYFYIRLLHGALTLFGNHFAAGLWLQIVLQMAAFVLLFFTVRKLAGGSAALTVLGFGMCAPYMVESALTLSPQMLYFFLLAVVYALMAAGGMRGLRPLPYLFTGVLTGLCCYLDVGGCVLFFPALGLIFSLREKMPGSGRKAAALALFLAGAAVGFVGCVALDALFCGEPFGDVADVWFYLYRPRGFRFPAVLGTGSSGPQGVLLTGLMAFGMFSFWCDRKRDHMGVCTLTAACVMLAGSLGIFTGEMPGYFMLYVLFAMLAGLGVGQCFYGVCSALPGDAVCDADWSADARPGAAQPAGGRQEAVWPGSGVWELAEPVGGVRELAESGDGERGLAEPVGGERELAESGGAERGLAEPVGGVRELAESGGVERGLAEFGSAEPELAEAVRQTTETAERLAEAAEAQTRRQSADVTRARRTEGQDPPVERRTREPDAAAPRRAQDFGAEPASEETQEKPCVQYIENPLPLPKKHVKRVLDFPPDSHEGGGEFDYEVPDDDDFDI